MPEPSFLVSLVSGGVAGLAVDVSLFPIDTVKTRMQAPEGFFKAGGFNGVYRGLPAAAAGSVPGAALFFSTYDTLKGVLKRATGGDQEGPAIHMTAASCGEVAACTVRVPTEVVKQSLQTGRYASLQVAVSTILKEQGVAGLYKGYATTIMREIPFAIIQFPLYEGLKKVWKSYRGRQLDSWQAALCGSCAGAFAACVTTPLDVAKTRLMLGNDAQGIPYKGTLNTLQRVHAEGGVPLLFSGVQPRTFWIFCGGYVFFGAYEFTKRQLQGDDE